MKLITSSLGFSINNKFLLKDINLTFETGCLYGVLGPNGSGKSTLLKLISGIWKPTTGHVSWNGVLLQHQSRQAISRTVSLVPQHPLPSFDFLVEDIVAMGRYAYDRRYWNAAEDSIVREALHVVDAWQLRRRRVNHLSYGERQRVYIARALVTESPILLLDEPTSSLDIQHQLEIWQLLEQFVREGKLVIVTTHDLTIAERYCRHISVLNHGQCISSGAYDQLMTPELLQQVFGVVIQSESPYKHYSLS